MADNAVNKLIQISVENNWIDQKKDITMTFVTDHIVAKIYFGGVLSLPDSYVIEYFIIAKF